MYIRWHGKGHVALLAGFFHVKRDAEELQSWTTRSPCKGLSHPRVYPRIIRGMVGLPADGGDDGVAPKKATATKRGRKKRAAQKDRPYMHQGIRDYVAMKDTAVCHMSLGFTYILQDYNKVMRYLDQLIDDDNASDYARLLAGRTKHELLGCRLEDPCRYRCCPICHTEHLLGLLDDVAQALPKKGKPWTFRFLTILHRVGYDPKQILAEVKRFKGSLEDHVQAGCKALPNIYPDFMIVGGIEVDIMPPFRSLVRDAHGACHNYVEEWKAADWICARKKGCLVEAGYDPVEARHGYFVTFHGIVMAPTDEHMEVLKRRLKTPNRVNGTALFQRSWQLQLKRFHEDRSLADNINRLVAYSFKNRAQLGNYMVSVKAVETQSAAELAGSEDEVDFLVPKYGRAVPFGRMGLYLRLNRNLPFVAITVRIGVRRAIYRRQENYRAMQEAKDGE